MPAAIGRTAFAGTLITLAPAAGPTSATCCGSRSTPNRSAPPGSTWPLDQPDFVATVAGLRRQTGLVITTDPDHPGADLVDRLPPDFVEVVLDDGPSPVDLVAQVARIAEDQRRGRQPRRP